MVITFLSQKCTQPTYLRQDPHTQLFQQFDTGQLDMSILREENSFEVNLYMNAIFLKYIFKLFDKHHVSNFFLETNMKVNLTSSPAMFQKVLKTR